MPHKITYIPPHQTLFPHPKHAPCKQSGPSSQSADSAIIRERESDDIPVEFLNEINISGLPVSKLTLKVGCPVMLLRNLSTREGLCNGTHGIVAVLKRWGLGGM